MKTIYLKDFIKTGKFGEIEVGVSTKSDVIAFMGEDYGWNDFDDTQIIVYGWYEFFYWTKTEKIFAVQNDHLIFRGGETDEDIQYENDQVKIDTWFIPHRENLKFHEVIDMLKREGISYKMDRHNFEGAEDFIRLENDITIDFHNEYSMFVFDEKKNEWDTEYFEIENPDDYVLNGIRLFKP